MQEKKKGQDIVTNMFLPAAIVMIFTQMTGVVANIIDGVVTSRFLGPDAYSSVSLLGPMVNIILLLASFISIGGQIVCSRKIGTGERDEANAIFTFSVIFGIGVAALFVVLSLTAPSILFRICGVSLDKRPELYEYMLEYLRGYLIGIPAVILVQILSPYLVMDNGKPLVSVSAGILCVTDVAGDLLNAWVFHGGLFGMGLATTVSVILQLLVLCIHFLTKKGYFRFSLKALTKNNLIDAAKNGSLSFVKKLATIVRDIATNRINLLIAVSTAAVAAKGMQSDINMLMFCFSIGIGRTLLTISAMYYGASDKEGLKRVFGYAMKLCVIITTVVGAILFVVAPLISSIYTDDPEVIELSVFSIRCLALGLGLDAITEAFQDYLQGIQNRKMVNILCFAERLFVPVATTLVLGSLFGTKGIMASVAVGKALLLLLLFLYLCIRCKGIPHKIEDYMFLPKGFGGSAEDNLNEHISSMEDVMRVSREAFDFCRAHNVDERHSNHMALFVEELAGNIVTHGKPRKKGGACADYRLFADNGKICLSLRDYCEAFDPMMYFELHKDDADEKSLGIRLVMKLAKDIRYVNTFNSNCLMIYMEV
ncbi:MAG: ATP-binding protein [Oscillospiraceae bacterium]|nr:ATP-binding protein [Oscillospiraceae bacterium]